jgi:CelD/BcsL family acetyltransferase involved in cellulose biosynthesis
VIATTQLELLSGKQCDALDVRVAWRELLTRSINPNALFQSPEWFDNKRETKPREDLLLAVLRQGGAVTGIAPFLIASQQFDLRPTKLRLNFSAAKVCGRGINTPPCLVRFSRNCKCMRFI